MPWRFAQSYGLHLGAFAGFFYGAGFFLSLDDQMTAWFGQNRELMVALLILHFAIYGIYWRVDTDRRAVDDRERSLKRRE